MTSYTFQKKFCHIWKSNCLGNQTGGKYIINTPEASTDTQDYRDIAYYIKITPVDHPVLAQVSPQGWVIVLQPLPTEKREAD